MSQPDQTLLERLAYGGGPATGPRLSRRPAVLWAAEMAYEALLFPENDAGFAISFRHAIAAFCAHLHGQMTVQSHYRGLLRLTLHDRLAHTAVLEAEAVHFRSTTERGSAVVVRPVTHAILGNELSQMIEFSGRLTLDPVGARHVPNELPRGHLDIISHIVALIAFQARLVAGFRNIADAPYEQYRRTA